MADDNDRSWIAELMQFERHEDVFTVSSPRSDHGRLFGGLIAAQGLAAAAATVEDHKLPQSLHAYFVRSGTPDVDVVLEVERTRDGRSFDTRRVTVRQAGAVILEMLASFHVAEDGVDEHPAAPPTVPLAESTWPASSRVSTTGSRCGSTATGRRGPGRRTGSAAADRSRTTQ